MIMAGGLKSIRLSGCGGKEIGCGDVRPRRVAVIVPKTFTRGNENSYRLSLGLGC